MPPGALCGGGAFFVINGGAAVCGGVFLLTRGGWEGRVPEGLDDGCFGALCRAAMTLGGVTRGAGTGLPPLAAWAVGVTEGCGITGAFAIC